MLYTGELLDESGLYYLRARYYDPKVGRFTTEDTLFGEIHNPITQNLYIYVGNNPMLYIDPSGHRMCNRANYRRVINQEWIGLRGMAFNANGAFFIGAGGSFVIMKNSDGDYAHYEVVNAETGTSYGLDSTISLIETQHTNDVLAFEGKSVKLVDASGGVILVVGGSKSVSNYKGKSIYWDEVRIGGSIGLPASLSAGAAHAILIKAKVKGKMIYGEGYEPIAPKHSTKGFEAWKRR